VALIGKTGNTQALRGETRKRTHARCRSKDNIKIVLKEMRWEVMDWIDLAQDRDK
jgi:hypothetical protein